MKSSTNTPNFLGLRTAIYRDPDLAKAKLWYLKILGIEPYFDQPFYVGFNVGGYELGLDPVPSSSASAGSVVVYWGVANADAALKRLLSTGAAERTNVQDVGEGIRVATVLDPFRQQFGRDRKPALQTSERLKVLKTSKERRKRSRDLGNIRQATWETHRSIGNQRF
jgi:hypothetical protein